MCCRFRHRRAVLAEFEYVYAAGQKLYVFTAEYQDCACDGGNGAGGETRQEMLDALGIDDLDAFNTCGRVYCGYAENEDVKLEISNSIWLNKEYPGAQNAKFQDGFVRLLTDYYAAEADTVTNADAAQRLTAGLSKNKRKN